MRSEPLMTIRQVADELGVSTDFVLREIERGRLAAAVTIRRPGGRTHRKVARRDVSDYKAVYCRSAS